MIRLIDHKRVEMTNDEFKMYKDICRSYTDDNAHRKGEDLFTDHFEVNGEGVIIFVKPPTKRYSSMEVFCFLISIMQNQHIRIIHDQSKAMLKEVNEKVKPIIDELQDLREQVKSFVEKSAG